MHRLSKIVFCLAVIALAGCGGGVKEEVIEVKTSQLTQIKDTLDRYAKGQPVMSEVTSFPYLVSEMKQVDPAKALILEKGLAEIEKNPTQAKAKATELLQQLGLNDLGDSKVASPAENDKGEKKDDKGSK